MCDCRRLLGGWQEGLAVAARRAGSGGGHGGMCCWDEGDLYQYFTSAASGFVRMIRHSVATCIATPPNHRALPLPPSMLHISMQASMTTSSSAWPSRRQRRMRGAATARASTRPGPSRALVRACACFYCELVCVACIMCEAGRAGWLDSRFSWRAGWLPFLCRLLHALGGCSCCA